jgi:hypothetical protein
MSRVIIGHGRYVSDASDRLIDGPGCVFVFGPRILGMRGRALCRMGDLRSVLSFVSAAVVSSP